MTTHVDTPGNRRPIRSVLDVLRARIDHDAFDAVVLALEAVVADLGYGDVRPLVGSILWIDRLREEGKRIAVTFAGENAAAALDIAGVAGRFDAVVAGPPTAATLLGALEALGVAPDRAVVVDTAPDGLAAAREFGCHLAIAVARGSASPEQLRRGGAATVVADLQELLGPT